MVNAIGLFLFTTVLFVMGLANQMGSEDADLPFTRKWYAAWGLLAGLTMIAALCLR